MSIQGHSEGVTGVFPHPFEPTFVTAGMDQVVIKWSLVTHKVIWKTHIEVSISNEPRHKKTCLRGLRSDKTQTDLLSFRD